MTVPRLIWAVLASLEYTTSRFTESRSLTSWVALTNRV